ncbi:PREDICTED: LOW QUALITY PROTEIN: protein SMAX1-LIKE 2-like [Tarenaya hassleriana]|uniref:LOW QUALITY PROTEIN: protein SMAX1-LIKE 2-like n=1 Tax=Tarenaya hassleriana TaxID=28532 RepID=UPI0008FD5333|nr:PREDICTED: LOW QUALITY PROTEIN: protein SMAX1-LIKE 2-like [Tarenaya hassleriana]
MRVDMGTIQQTLTPDAASVLNQSISEAARRNHGQTTPLHVAARAATLLSSSSGFLRQACIKSHPNSSHPLQCRALELCFSVALERLPTAETADADANEAKPPLSNALMAALKRAQAHQRRGCPEQQQQPLLAVKVELEQLIISILDDPSVSRVMREASFSSPTVKSAIEQSLGGSNSSGSPGPVNPASIGFGYRPVPGPVNRNLYLNPRLHQPDVAQTGLQRTDEAKRVVDIMVRTRKRNPVLVGESMPQILVKEILGKIESGEISAGTLRNSQVIRVEKEIASEKAQMTTRVKEISGLVETRMENSDLGRVVLDLGDLKWLVEQQQASNAAAGSGAVAEMGRLLDRYRGRLWLIGTATCETYLRCQVYYPSMENDWDIQAIPITAKSPPAGIFPRLVSNNNAMLLSSPIESISQARSLHIPAVTLPSRRVHESSDSGGGMRCCPQCLQNYKNNIANLETSSSDRTLLPQWLQNAEAGGLAKSNVSDKKLTKDQELVELQKKWNEACLRLHPNYHWTVSETIVPSSVSLLKLQSCRNPSASTLQLNSCSDRSRPGSPVGTDLVLGRPNRDLSSPEKTRESHIDGVLGNGSEKLGESFDIDSFKKLRKGLAETVWWQHDAASAVAGTITQFKHGNGKSRGISSKGDVWFLFTGPDRIGKRKMASALSDLVSRAQPTTISLGKRRDDEHSSLSLRGKTALDRVTDVVRKNPFAVIVIEDIDEADSILRDNLKLAMERGRISDSHGREVSLGNVIVILTMNWSPGNEESLSQSFDPIDETNLESLISKGWQLRFSVRNKTRKRMPSWLYNDDQERAARQRKEISFDLNEMAKVDEDKANRSPTNSSDVTTDHDQEDNIGLIHKLLSPPQSAKSVYRELRAIADDVIFFRPVDFGLIKSKTSDSLNKRFCRVLGFRSKLEINDDALERIAGSIWLGKISLEEWMDETMISSLNQMKHRVSSGSVDVDDEVVVFKLELDDDLSDRVSGCYLPGSIRTPVD